MAVRATFMSLFQHLSLSLHTAVGTRSQHSDWATVGRSRYRLSIPLRRTFISPSKYPDRHYGSHSLALTKAEDYFLGRETMGVWSQLPPLTPSGPDVTNERTYTPTTGYAFILCTWPILPLPYEQGTAFVKVITTIVITLQLFFTDRIVWQAASA